MKKIRNMLFLCIFVFVICVGASFAWYVWQGSNLNVTVDFAGLDPYIDYRESSGDCGTGSLASSAIVFQKKDIGTNLDIYGQLYLHIDSATSNDLFKSSGYKWRLCKIDDNNETTLVSSGNFVGEAVGNNIPLSVDFELDNYSTSADTKYVIETYIDEDLNNNNLDISNSAMVSTWDPGAESVPSDQGILYIRNIEYSAGVIRNLGFYSSKYEITEYMITDSVTEPNANDERWIPVTSSEATTEPGYIANVTNVNHTMTNINNICIKDSNGNVTCKSIEKYNDVISNLPSATLCVETTYNGEPHQLVSETSGIGYTLSGYTGTNAGDYTITATLKPGYQWSNGTTNNITFICSIVYEYYTITLDSNGGSGGTSTLYERYADGIYLDSSYTKKMTTSANAITVPTKTGYTFDGYYYDDTKMIDANGYITSELTNMNRTDKTLRAHWTANTYSIVYVGNGNTGGSTTSQTCTYDSNCTIASNGFTKTGYTFVGWTTNSNGTDDGYNWTGWSGTWKYVNGQYGIANNTLTLTARWVGNTYTVHYYLGNGSSAEGVTELTSSTGTTTCTYGSTCTLQSFSALNGIFPYSSQAHAADSNITNYSWSFYGWNTDTDVTDEPPYADGASFTYSTVGDMSLYAIGRRSFSFYGGTTPSKIASGLYQYWNPCSTSTSQLTSINIPAQTENISGWTFHGYRAGSNTASSSVTFSASKAGTTQTPSYKTYTVNRSVYKRDLTINYNGNGATGGSTASTTATQYYNSGKDSSTMAISTPSFTLASNGFTKTDHLFSKWAEGSTSGTQYAEGATYTGFAPAVNDSGTTKTMYAIWIEKVYQIYNSSGTSIGYADSLESAISQVPADGTIKALKNNSSGAVTVNKNVILDTSRYTITMNGVLTNNSGNSLSITSSEGGSINFQNSSEYNIQNDGTLYISGNVTISSISSLIYVSSSGVFNMSGGILTSSNDTLTTGGVSTISGGSIESTGSSGIVVIKGSLSFSCSNISSKITVTGYYYGIIVKSNIRYSNIDVTFGGSTPQYIYIEATSTENGYSSAYLAASHSTYSVTTTIYGGNFYGYGYGIGNDAGNTMTINSSSVVHIESDVSSAIYNEGNLYVAESSGFSNGIPVAKVDDNNYTNLIYIASNNSYVLTNSGTLYYGYGVLGYSGQAASSDSSKRAIYLPGGTMYLVGGRIYHSNTVDSAFYRTNGTISVSGSFTTAYGEYLYVGNLGGFSFTNTKYSYKSS